MSNPIISILNSKNYFERIEDGSWIKVDVSSCLFETEKDEKVIEMLDDLKMLDENVIDLENL